MITQQELKKILSYNPVTGEFTWNRNYFRVKKGQRAGYLQNRGYIYIKISQERYSAASLAVLYMEGHWPAVEVDHINRVKNDNRYSNLREATRSQNMMNTAKPLHNTSGYKGVSFHTPTWRFQVNIIVDGVTIHLGRYKTVEEAAKIYKEAAVKHFGEFAETI